MDRRRLLQAGTVAGAAGLLAGRRPVRAAPAATADPVGVRHRVVERLPVEGVASGLTHTGPVAPGRFSSLSFELPAGLAGLYVRSRSDRGWSAWTWLPVATDHAPDPDGPEPLGRARRASELLWTARADGFAVATPAGAAPDQLRTHVVDTLADPLEEVGALVDRALEDLLGRVGSAPPRPRIVGRDQWGANESWRRGSPRYARPRRAVVHHTATANGYGRGEVPAILRAILHHHTRVRGWNDIGYNFLVDRFGRIFEGRHGGVDAGVIGAHARGHNTGSIGVAVLGHHGRARPTAPSRDALADLLAWKYHVHEVPSDPDHRVRHQGRSYPATCGHRDVGWTACPGHHVHDALPALRRAVHQRS